MNLEDREKKFDEDLKSTLIKCAYIASLHQALKDDVKMIKEMKKENEAIDRAEAQKQKDMEAIDVVNDDDLTDIGDDFFNRD